MSVTPRRSENGTQSSGSRRGLLANRSSPGSPGPTATDWQAVACDSASGSPTPISSRSSSSLPKGPTQYRNATSLVGCKSLVI
jgi:hypothetical protein